MDEPPPGRCVFVHNVRMDTSSISFVIPVFNEEASLVELRDRIDRVCQENGIPYEMIFVDDGSTDGSWKKIQSFATEAPSVAGVRFRRNFGKAAALAAGIAEASKEIVVTMDADLQDDPKEVPRFLAKLNEGFDVVSGWKKIRHDPWHKTMPSLVFNRLVSWITGVQLHDHNCGFKAYRCKVFDDVELYGERHRFVPVLAAAKGWRVGELDVEHHPRQFGYSKYGVSRLVKGFLDLLTVHLLTGYAGRPLHLIGSIGMIFFSIGGLGLAYLTFIRFLSHRLESIEDVHLHQSALFYYFMLAILLGAQFLTTGLLAELIVSRTSQRESFFAISESTGFADPSSDPSDQRSPS